MDLKGKVVLITGGAVRVGRAITVEFIRAGANVFCHYYHSEQEAYELKKAYPSVNLLKGNLRQINTIRRLAKTVLEKSGTIDVLVNNAAIFLKTPLGSVTEEDWDNLFEINLKSHFFISQEISKTMLAKKSGKIINIADTNGLRPWPSYIPYSLTKSGVIALTKGLAITLAPFVQVNCINPGPVLMPDTYTEEQISRAIEKTLLKRAGHPEDVAAAARFLAEDGDYITGLILSVDGGRSIR